MAIPAMVSTSDIPVIMTPAVLQRVMGLSKGKTYELIHRAGFPSLRVGKVIRIPRDAFFRWLEEQAAAE